MFWTINRTFLISCLLILDVLLIFDIQKKNSYQKTTIESPKTVTLNTNEASNYSVVSSRVANRTITLIPTKPISITPSPTPKPEPTKAPSENSTNNNPPSSYSGGESELLNEINNFRASNGLSSVSSDPYTCGFAITRAGEIVNGFNHDGFSNRVNSKSLPYPSYREVVENIAMGGDITKIVQGWIDSPGHHANMLKDTPYACVGKSGDYYAYEAWRP